MRNTPIYCGWLIAMKIQDIEINSSITIEGDKDWCFYRLALSCQYFGHKQNIKHTDIMFESCLQNFLKPILAPGFLF